MRLLNLAGKPSSWCVSGRTCVKSLKAATLLELIAALTLVLLVVGFSVANWRPLLRREAIELTRQQLQNTLSFAQNTALALGESVMVCGGSAKQCNGDWSAGILVQTQAGRLLRYWSNTAQVRIVWNSSFDQNNRLIFKPSGFTLGQQGRFYLCEDAAKAPHALAIVVNAAGRQRIDRRQAVQASCSAWVK